MDYLRCVENIFKFMRFFLVKQDCTRSALCFFGLCAHVYLFRKYAQHHSILFTSKHSLVKKKCIIRRYYQALLCTIITVLNLLFYQ